MSDMILPTRINDRVTHFSNCIWLQLRVRIFLISSFSSNRAINNNARNLRHSEDNNIILEKSNRKDSFGDEKDYLRLTWIFSFP